MQNDAADQLYVEVAHIKDAPAGLAAHGEGFDQKIVERLAISDSLFELDGFLGKLGV
jgi:hypothetical protein